MASEISPKRKLLNRRNYGSIPHLPGSRRNAPSDKVVSEGTVRIVTERLRDSHDDVIVHEKVDGSNVGVLKKDGVLYPLTRAGYHANTSQFEQHHMFCDWLFEQDVYERFDAVLDEGERLV